MQLPPCPYCGYSDAHTHGPLIAVCKSCKTVFTQVYGTIADAVPLNNARWWKEIRVFLIKLKQDGRQEKIGSDQYQRLSHRSFLSELELKNFQAQDETDALMSIGPEGGRLGSPGSPISSTIRQPRRGTLLGIMAKKAEVPGLKPKKRRSRTRRGKEVDDADEFDLSAGEVNWDEFSEQYRGYPDDAADTHIGSRSLVPFAIRSENGEFVVVNRERESLREENKNWERKWWAATEWVLEWFCIQQELFLRQESFLYLRPCSEKRAADAYVASAHNIEVGSSHNKISRICRLTLLELPWSQVSVRLRMLFSSPFRDSTIISQQAADCLVISVVTGEDRCNPLSDEDISRACNTRIRTLGETRELFSAKVVRDLLRPRNQIAKASDRREVKALAAQ